MLTYATHFIPSLSHKRLICGTAKVLFGRYNPSGKLAVTMYPPDFVKRVLVDQPTTAAFC